MLRYGRRLLQSGISIGRDSFYKIVSRYNLTRNSKRKAWKKSHPKSKPAKNLVIAKTFRRVFEVLFADYTEIETEEGKVMLLLIEDLFSRYICSYRICNTCKADPVVEALEESMALKKSLNIRYKTIFHTDKGTEFVNRKVKALSELHNIELSNTGIFHCYENAFMESLNRTLKHSFGLINKYKTREEALGAIKVAINGYNQTHRHSSLGKRVPYCVLMSYTGVKRGTPEVKSGSCPPPGRGARTYCKSLIVKIMQIKLDKSK